jgi:EmrB/QacA subfamily drug resistance transporter
VLAACIMSCFMAAVEATIVATAMPTIVGELGGFNLYGWVFAVYLLSQAVTIPIYGKLADLYGRKRVFFVGAIIFLIGSTLCGFAHSMIMLAACRALQGLGAGSILPISFTIIGDIYAPTERARAQSLLSAVWGMAAMVGPLLGAVLVSHFGWAYVFWLNVPVGIAAMLLLGLFFTETAPHRAHRIDAFGALLLASGSGALILALLQMHELGSWAVPVLLFAMAALLGLAWRERHVAEPMLPLSLWRNRTILVVNLSSLPIGAMMMGVNAFLPPYVQGVMGSSTLAAGMALAAMSIGWSSASPVAARLMARTSYRTASILGAVLMLTGSLLLVAMRPGDGALWAAAGSALMGAGLGFTISTFTVAVQGSVGWAERGIATSSTVFTRILGQSIGTALLGAVLNLGLEHHLPGVTDAIGQLMVPDPAAAAELARLAAAAAESLHGVYVAVALLTLLGLIGTLLLPPGNRPDREASGARR